MLLPHRLAGACALLASVTAGRAQAKPQWNAGWETAVCSAGDSLSLSRPKWCNALHADLMLLREGSAGGFDLGPSLRLGTANFDDLRLDAGLSVLLPITESFPIMLEAGPHLRNLKQPGVFASAFFGLRSFNHYGHYEMSTGLVFLAERSFSAGTPSAVWIAARIDAQWLAMPFLFMYNGLK